MTEQMDQSLEIIELREELQRTKLLLQNCNGDIVRADRELASLREQLKESSFWANEQANTLNALADRNAGLSSELEKSNHNYLSIVEQLKQQEEVIRELIPIAEERFEIAADVVKCWIDDDKPNAEQKLKRMKAIIEKAKSLITKNK